MGCASSKPSSSGSSSSKSKNKKDNKKDDGNKIKKVDASKLNNKTNANNNDLDELIKIDTKFINQIDHNRNEVVDFIVKSVRRDLNAELVGANSTKKQHVNLASVANAALSAPDNDDLIIDAASKALQFISNKKCDTYKSLSDSLKASTFLCKNQAHKNRICELTVETIRRCLKEFYSSSSGNKTNLIDYLRESLTPPQSPQRVQSQKQQSSSSSGDQNPLEFDESILLTRAEANKVARILFLTNRARPVIHASYRKRGAYFVNILLDDGTEVPATREQIEDIISFSSSKINDQPTIYEVAESFLNNSEATLKLTPIALLDTQHHKMSPPASPSLLTPPLSASSTTANNKLPNTPETPVAVNDESIQHQKNLLRSLQDETPVSEAVQAENEQQQQAEDEAEQQQQQLEEQDEDNQKIEVQRLLEGEREEDSDNNLNESNLRETDASTTNVKQEDTTIPYESSSDKPSLTTTTNEEDSTTLETARDDSADFNNNNNNANNTTTNNDSANDQNDEENGGVDPVKKQAELDDRQTNNHSFKTEPPVNDPKNEEAAKKIQAGFRGQQTRSSNEHLNGKDELNVEDAKAVEAATTIQATFRGYKTRKQIKPTLKNNQRSMSNEHLEKKTANSSMASAAAAGSSDNNNSSTSNNANARKKFTNNSKSVDHNDDEESMSPDSSSASNGADTEKAAIKIQATFRGYKSRKELETLKKGGDIADNENAEKPNEDKDEEDEADTTTSNNNASSGSNGNNNNNKNGGKKSKKNKRNKRN